MTAPAPSTPPELASSRSLLRGNVLWLSVVSFLNDAASEMIYPLLPLFLTLTLGAGAAMVGMIEGVAEASSSLLKLAGGKLADRTGKRRALVTWGYGIAALARPLVALATGAWQVLLIRFSDRVGKGLRTAPRDALLAESVPAEVRGSAFGIHRAADHAGAVVGPLMASGLLLLMPGRLRLVFGLALIPGLLALGVVLLKVRDTHPEPATPAHAAADGPLPPVATLGAPFRRFLAVVALFALGNSSDAFLLLRARQLGVAMALIPLLWAVLHVSKMTWSVVGGRLSDRGGARRTVLAGWLLYAAVYAGFAFAHAPWQAWALFVVYGLFFGLTEAPEKSLVAEFAPAAQRGSAFGWYHAVLGVSALAASMLFGAVWQLWGAQGAFLAGAGIALVAAAVFPLALGRRLNPI
jgi:MFS family permease